MAKSYFVVGCNNHNTMKDKKIQGLSFPNNNDKHSEISIFAVTAGTKCQQLSNKTTKDDFSTDMYHA